MITGHCVIVKPSIVRPATVTSSFIYAKGQRSWDFLWNIFSCFWSLSISEFQWLVLKIDSNKASIHTYSIHCVCFSLPLLVRDRPFNLKRGGVMVFCFVQNFFLYNTRVRIFIFLSREAQIFFPEFNISLYDKNSESDFFFLHQNPNIFFSNIGNQNIFLEKKHNPPPLQVKWSFPNG